MLIVAFLLHTAGATSCADPPYTVVGINKIPLAGPSLIDLPPDGAAAGLIVDYEPRDRLRLRTAQFIGYDSMQRTRARVAERWRTGAVATGGHRQAFLVPRKPLADDEPWTLRVRARPHEGSGWDRAWLLRWFTVPVPPPSPADSPPSVPLRAEWVSLRQRYSMLFSERVDTWILEISGIAPRSEGRHTPAPLLYEFRGDPSAAPARLVAGGTVEGITFGLNGICANAADAQMGWLPEGCLTVRTAYTAGAWSEPVTVCAPPVPDRSASD